MVREAFNTLGTIISVKNIAKEYLDTDMGKSVLALKDISFSVQSNEILSIIGPSGCGKTTLLKLIGGLLPYDNGKIVVGERVVTGPGSELSVVFQDFALLPWATVLDNVSFGLTVKNVPRKEREAIANEWIQTVGLGDFAHHYPRQLSGGMQQRVGLARALAVEPSILLMDEPFGALDAQTRRVLQEELLTLFEETNLTVVLVTHSIDEAILLGDRVLLMSRSPGEIHETIDVPLPRPRPDDVDRHPGFYETRAYLWQQLRELQ